MSNSRRQALDLELPPSLPVQLAVQLTMRLARSWLHNWLHSGTSQQVDSSKLGQLSTGLRVPAQRWGLQQHLL